MRSRWQLYSNAFDAIELLLFDGLGWLFSHTITPLAVFVFPIALIAMYFLGASNGVYIAVIIPWVALLAIRGAYQRMLLERQMSFLGNGLRDLEERSFPEEAEARRRARDSRFVTAAE